MALADWFVDFEAPQGEDVSGAETGPTETQCIIAIAGLGALFLCVYYAAEPTWLVLHIALVLGFVLSASTKLALGVTSSVPEEASPLPEHRLPTYTILVPLYREGAVVGQLVRALSAIDYPRDRLQAILLLEEGDAETLGALTQISRPPFIEVLVKPPGGPRTKPNALNAGLRRAWGEFITVYDAEDLPARGQLREAAARFFADPGLACVQAPLQISNAETGWIQYQFALEYAGQFEAVLRGLARLNAPFPLGGTSNHFRAEILRRIGGWDPYNVTEDADLGFRIGTLGGRIGVLASPTYEDAPRLFSHWLPQRTRWVKGYMQTWGVHMRRPFAGGLRGFLSLQITLGAGILGAAMHGPMFLVLLSVLVSDAISHNASPWLWLDLMVFIISWGAASLANAVGAWRAGLPIGFRDALMSLAYWPLQSLAFLWASSQLVFAPYYWNKTPHAPVQEALPAPLDADAPWSVSPAA